MSSRHMAGLVAVSVAMATAAAAGPVAAASSDGGASPEATRLVASPAPETAAPLGAPPYVLPWLLRPVSPTALARVDTTAAVFNDANGNLDKAVATVVTSSYPVNGNWAPVVRLGFIGNDAPGEATDGRAYANPLLGMTHARGAGALRFALFGGTTIPVGSGGGERRNLRAARSNAASMIVRPVDDAMFAVDHLAVILGADAAYVKGGFTAQAEATVLEFIPVRAGDGGAGGRFGTETSVGLHLGTFIGARLSVSGEVHHARWLWSPEAPSTWGALAIGGTRTTTTVAVGPRAHFRVGKAWLRPGLAIVRGFDSRGLDAPLLTPRPTGLQLDVALTF